MKRVMTMCVLVVAFAVPCAAASTGALRELQGTIHTSLTRTVAPTSLQPPMTQWAPNNWWSHFSLAQTPAYRVCFGDAGAASAPLTACSVFGNRSSSHRAFLLGDSRAFQWLPSLQRWGQSRQWRVSALTKANCRPWTNTPYYSGSPGQRTGASYPTCASFNASVVQAVKTVRPSYVFVTAMRGRTGTTTFETNSQIRDGMIGFARAMQALGAVVVFIGPNPEWFASSGLAADIFPPDCVVRHIRSVAHCVGTGATTGGRLGVIEPGYFNAMVDAARSTSSVYLPTPDLFCVRKVMTPATSPNAAAYGGCPLLVGETLAYLDRQHITREYAQRIAPAFIELLDNSIVPPPQ